MFKGRKFNDECGSCGPGSSLHPVTQSVRVGTTRSGVAGQPVMRDLIVSLGCNQCGLLYASADASKTVRDVLEEAAHILKSDPDLRPQKCLLCDVKLVPGKMIPELFADVAGTKRPGQQNSKYVREYLHCPKCYRVPWSAPCEAEREWMRRAQQP